VAWDPSFDIIAIIGGIIVYAKGFFQNFGVSGKFCDWMPKLLAALGVKYGKKDFRKVQFRGYFYKIVKLNSVLQFMQVLNGNPGFIFWRALDDGFCSLQVFLQYFCKSSARGVVRRLSYTMFTTWIIRK